MFTSKKSLICTKWRWMWSIKYLMSTCVYKYFLLLRKRSS